MQNTLIMNTGIMRPSAWINVIHTEVKKQSYDNHTSLSMKKNNKNKIVACFLTILKNKYASFQAICFLNILEINISMGLSGDHISGTMWCVANAWVEYMNSCIYIPPMY